MWSKFLLAVAVAAVLTSTSAQVSVAPESTEITIRECDDLVFVLTIVSGTYTEPYQVSVTCGPSPVSEGSEVFDFADGNATNSVTISMNVSLIEVPLPLNDDAAIEQNEQFLCFFTSTAGVRGDVVTLTVIDNDLNCSADQTSGCGVVPPPSCANPNPTQTDGVGCFCPDGMLINENGSCVVPNDCIDPQSVIRCNDTVVGDPLYEVPVIVDEEGEKTSLCYEVQGEADQHFNLISDICVSVNALYTPMVDGSGNFISKVGVLAEDNSGVCQEIEVDLTGCTVRVNGEVITTVYNQDGINIRRRTNRVRIAVPNCQNVGLVLWVICEVRSGQNMIKLVTVRGFNLRPTSHGLIGQFWNVKTEAERYNVTVEDSIVPDTNHYAVTVSTPGDTRRFFAWKAPRTWERKSMNCLYCGNVQGGPLKEVTSLSDSVIQGSYDEYEVSGLFDPDYKYNMFNSQCV